MELQELETLKNLKKGIYHKAIWKSGSNGYEKVSNGVVRIVKYGNINGVMVKGNKNTIEKTLIADFVYFNENTNNVLVQLAKTNNPRLKAKTTYYLNGVEITKSEYEIANPPRKNYDSPIFRVKLENLIAIN